MNEAQVTALRALCERFNVPFSPEHYHVYPATSTMMAGWAEGWPGGPGIQAEHPTIYVGCSPEGRIHS